MELKKWNILESETAFENRWWKIVQETVELPDGSVTGDYFVNHHPGGVIVFALTEEGKVVVNRQYKHGAREVVEELTIGRLDETDTSPIEAAKRELEEETGYGGGTWEPLGVFLSNPTSSTSRLHAFLARGVRKVAGQDGDPREIVEVSEIALPEFVARVRDGRFSTSAAVAASFLALERLGKLELKP